MKITDYSCKYFRSNEVLKMYLADVRKHDVPTIEEEEVLFDKIKNGTQAESDKAREELILKNQRFVYAIAKIYARNEDEVLDYVNEGNIGLSEAIDKFDPSLGFKFITYAVLYIKREMNYYLRTTNNMIKRPNNMKLGKKVETVKHKFYAENGYIPTEEDIVDIIKEVYGINIKDKSDVFDLTVTSISEKMDDDKYTVEDDDEFNRKTSCEIEYEDSINKEYNAEMINNILATIPKDNEEMIRMLFGIGTDRAYTVTEVGAKFELDPQVVVLIKNKVLEYLRQNKREYKIAI